MAWDRSDRAARLPPDWRRLKRRVRRRDADVCHVCGGPGADAVDHIVAGDDHSLGNLAPIHQDVWPYCHVDKTAAESRAVRHRMRDARRRRAEPHPLDRRE